MNEEVETICNAAGEVAGKEGYLMLGFLINPLTSPPTIVSLNNKGLQPEEFKNALAMAYFVYVNRTDKPMVNTDVN